MEISITGYTDTAPTLFSIHVTIQDRVAYVVQRRYSEFAKFATELEQEMGEPAPIALPSKKWLGTKSKEFLDERRRGLEIFLRRLLKREEWRDSLALQTFLETSKHNRQNDRSLSSYEPAAVWAKATAEVRTMIQNARDSSGVEGRRLILNAKSRLRELESSLIEDKGLGEGEYTRRRNVVLELTRALNKVENMSSSRLGNIPDSLSNTGRVGNVTSNLVGEKGLNGSASGESLFSNSPVPRANRRVLGAGGETDRTRQFNNSGLMTLQNDEMQKQDEVIESLRKTIRTQRELGEQIHEELEYHNRLLDDLDQDTHATSAKLNQARRRVKKFT